MASSTVFFSFCVVLQLSGGLASFFLHERLPYYYYQHQRGYWPDTEKTTELDDDLGYRYRQSYQNSYQQDLQYNGYPTFQVQQVPYPFLQQQQQHHLARLPQQQLPQVPQQLPQVPQQLPHVPQQLPQGPQQLSQVPQQLSQVPQQLSQVPQQLPQVPQQLSQVPQQLSQVSHQQLPQIHHQEPFAYQLFSLGPDVPVLIKMPDQRTTVLPARTVYSLPGFLEGIVQNVQNYYSVFNPLEVLKVQRQNSTILFQAALGAPSPAASTTTEGSDSLSTEAGSTEAPSKESSTEEISTDTAKPEEATTEAGTTEGQETTTDSSSSDSSSE